MKSAWDCWAGHLEPVLKSKVGNECRGLESRLKAGLQTECSKALSKSVPRTCGDEDVPTPGLVRLAQVIVIFCALLIGCAGCQKSAVPATKPSPEVTFKPQEMADALHAVIAADREVYSRHILQRLQADEKLIKASENWQAEKALPVPAQVLRMGSEAVQEKGAEFHYVLRSLWPINPRNAPETATEKAGLQSVLEHPETNYYSAESLGGRRYFTAVYPDRATVPSCAECHNAKQASGKRDFKLGDVMGGMVVRVPLEF